MFFISRKIAGELYVSIDQVNKAIEEKKATTQPPAMAKENKNG